MAPMKSRGAGFLSITFEGERLNLEKGHGLVDGCKLNSGLRELKLMAKGRIVKLERKLQLMTRLWTERENVSDKINRNPI